MSVFIKVPSILGVKSAEEGSGVELGTFIFASFLLFKPLRRTVNLPFFLFCYTPKYGSWLNMAEIELSILGRQCLNR